MLGLYQNEIRLEKLAGLALDVHPVFPFVISYLLLVTAARIRRLPTYIDPSSL